MSADTHLPFAAGPTEAAANDVASEAYRPARAWWAVAVLMLLNAVSLIDRNIVSLFLIEIRADLHLTDFQVSLLQGLAFACFYGIAGLLLGALVDRYPVRIIIFACVTLWSLAAAATGLARNYGEMLGARMMVGVGEGGVNPASQSLIAASFPASRASLPMSLFVASGLIGMGLSYLCGGILVEAITARSLPGLEGLAPWRQVLIVTSLPGLVIAFLAFSLAAPRPQRRSIAEDASWTSFWRFLRAHRGLFPRILGGYCLTAMVTNAALAWAPTYARRVTGMSAGDVGWTMGLIAMVAGTASMTLYGLAVDRQVSRGRTDYAFRLYLVGAAVGLPLAIAGFTMDRQDLFLVAIVAVQCILCAAVGPGMAIIQAITPPTMRGRMGALMLLSLGVLGYAGVVLAGALTDFLFGDPARVGASVALIMLLLGPAAAWCLWSARPGYLARIRELGRMRAAG